MVGRLVAILVAVCGLCAGYGCNSTGCTDNQSSLPLAGFYSADGQAISLSNIEVGGVGAPGDSLLYPSGTAYSSIYLPFRANSDNTSYYFHYTQDGLDDNAFNDTISFTYSSRPFFASEECGAMLEYTIKSMSFTNHLIKNIEIVDTVITNTDIQRIKIFFRTE